MIKILMCKVKSVLKHGANIWVQRDADFKRQEKKIATAFKHSPSLTVSRGKISKDSSEAYTSSKIKYRNE